MTRPRVVISFLLICFPAGRPAEAQASPAAAPGSELALHLEPVAVGARLSFTVVGQVRIGPSLSVGPFEGVTLRRGVSGDLKEWATTYATVSIAAHPHLELVLSPIGAVLALDDDFSSVYPSAQFGVQTGGSRWLLGSDLRVIRIAGSNGTGLYWVQLVPVRVGVRWRR